MKTGALRRDDLLTQEEYAERLDVTPGWISKATRQGNIVDGKYYPARDAVVDSNGTLVGYRKPTKGAVPSNSSPASPGAQKHLDLSPSGGGSGRGGGASRNHSASGSAGLGQPSAEAQARENGSSRSHSASSGQSGRTDVNSRDSRPQQTASTETANRSAGGQGSVPAPVGLDGAAGSLAHAVAQDQGALRGTLRLGGAAGGAVFLYNLGDGNLLPALLGAAAGFGIVEYSLHAEQG
jgi:hypothetical protein